MAQKTVRIKVRFFGHTAELAGCRERVLEVSQPTVAGVVKALRREIPTLTQVLDGSVRFAVGTEYVQSDRKVKEGDVVSLLPPVGGG